MTYLSTAPRCDVTKPCGVTHRYEIDTVNSDSFCGCNEVVGQCGADSGLLEVRTQIVKMVEINPYPTAFPYGNGMVLHFYQQQESSTTKTVHKVINKGLKTYV